jgi:hypothetical protein
MEDDDLLPDPKPTSAQMRAIQALTPADIAEIDATLLAHASETFRKMARVIGGAMMHLDGRYQSVPDIYFAQRVAELVKAGRLQSQGDLHRMRYSEARLPAG